MTRFHSPFSNIMKCSIASSGNDRFHAVAVGAGPIYYPSTFPEMCGPRPWRWGERILLTGSLVMSWTR